MKRPAAAAAIAAAVSASPAAADALQDQVLAGIRATRTGDVGFAQVTRIERTGAPAKEITRRYDPQGGGRWSLVRVDGRAPTPKETADIAKQTGKAPLPSYAELGKWFGTPATRVSERPGAVTYRFARLPKGLVKIGSHDASEQTVADAMVNTAEPRPYVERIRFASTGGFRIMLVAKVERYVLTAGYAPLPDGRMFPATAEVEMSGSLMGKAGVLRTRVRYEDARPAR